MSASGDQPKRSRFRKKRYWALAILLILIIAAGASGGSKKGTGSTNSPGPVSNSGSGSGSSAASSGSGKTSSSAAPAPPNPKPKHEPVAACIGGNVAGQPYGGIGASVSAFKNSHPIAANGPPASYQDGIAFYEIKSSVHGCVSEYTITESTTPTQSARDLLFLVSGIGLPGDAHQLVDQNTCAVWSSGSLKKVTGHLYAVGFVEVVPQGDATGIVDMSAGDSPKC